VFSTKPGKLRLYAVHDWMLTNTSKNLDQTRTLDSNKL